MKNTKNIVCLALLATLVTASFTTVKAVENTHKKTIKTAVKADNKLQEDEVFIGGTPNFDEKTGKYISNEDNKKLNVEIIGIDDRERVSAYVGDFPVTVMNENTKKEKYMKKDQTIAVKLTENASTGYTWNYTIENPDIIEFTADGVEEINKDLVGSPSNHYWGFKAKKEGSTTITFNLYREWEGKEKSIKTYKYKVSVVQKDSKINPYKDNKETKLQIINTKVDNSTEKSNIIQSIIQKLQGLFN
ncbi:protease inhibitor I42 family protein [Clostridium ganghwense]|uniref:Protease inhibitor I42 family protein n=1 Tax=Clostridium ganghwense TaxID=312089 RepID=A0ABT4CTJ1_9CLOT|nr:protease inhibitor I42 family protein [Clostridium ganghwense]MCY6371356.1 protease inhibitor I42 family protein [Clostridium ganghwense]